MTHLQLQMFFQHVSVCSKESRLEEKEAAMESWRAERDTLVAALEVQLQKLLASQAGKDKLIKELQQQSTASPAGVSAAPHLPPHT